MRPAVFVFLFVLLFAGAGTLLALHSPTGNAATPWWIERSYTAQPPQRQDFVCRCVTPSTTGYCIAKGCWSDYISHSYCVAKLPSSTFCKDCALTTSPPPYPANQIIATATCA